MAKRNCPTVSIYHALDSIVVGYGETFTVHLPGGSSVEIRMPHGGPPEVFTNLSVRRFDEWRPMRADAGKEEG